MSNYNVVASWSTKDALAAGETLKIISATELNTEFQAIATMSSQKAELNGDTGEAWSCASLNIDGTAITPSATELNYVDGVTSAIQTQVDSKATLAEGTGDSQLFTKAQAVTSANITIDVGTEDADLSLTNVFVVSVEVDAQTLTFSNQVTGGCYTFIIKNTGAYDIDFGTGFYFSGGEPTITSGASKVDLVSCVSDGTNLYCSINYDLTGA